MKHKFRIVFNLFFASFLILFTSCEAEKDFTKNTKLIVKKCSMRDVNLHSDIKLNKAVSYLKGIQTKSLQDNLNARLIYDENSGLYYDDEKGVYMSKDGNESYTFPVIQHNSNEEIKNITFNKNSSNEYDIYIVKYDFTKEDLNNYTKEELAEREINFQALLKNGIEYPVEAQWTICFTTEALIAVPIDQGELTGNFGYELTWVAVSSACFSGTNTGGSESSSNGNNSGDNNNETGGGDIITGAVIDEMAVLPPVSDNPCEDLADLAKTDNADIKPEIDWLKTKVDEPLEYGVEVERTTNYDGSISYPKTQVTSTEQYSVPLTTGGNHIGAAHNHPIRSYAIPSFGDIKWLRDCYVNASTTRKQYVFTIIVVKDASGIINVYSLKINDFLSLSAKVDEIWNSTDYYGLSDKKKLDKIHKEQRNKIINSGNQLEKSFLQQFGDFGIDLYKATNDNLNSWDKLELSNPEPLIVVHIPC